MTKISEVEMRPIDADELLLLYEGVDESLKVSLRVVKQNIKDMPTIKAEPIVHCKDCKHWAMHSWCSRLAPFDKVYMGADDYCSKGKRRDEVE